MLFFLQPKKPNNGNGASTILLLACPQVRFIDDARLNPGFVTLSLILRTRRLLPNTYPEAQLPLSDRVLELRDKDGMSYKEIGAVLQREGLMEKKGFPESYDLPALLRQELRAREVELRGEMLAFSGVTDCYQPLEASYGITRQCLEVCRDHRQRVGIITKGALVERDRDLIAEVHQRAGAFVRICRSWSKLPLHS